MTEQEICYQIEDNEADALARMRRSRAVIASAIIAVEPPEIPATEAVAVCRRIYEELHNPAPRDYCECDQQGLRHCGMCDG